MKLKKLLCNLGMSVGIIGALSLGSAITASGEMVPLKCVPTETGGHAVHYSPIKVQ